MFAFMSLPVEVASFRDSITVVTTNFVKSGTQSTDFFIPPLKKAFTSRSLYALKPDRSSLSLYFIEWCRN